MLTKGYLAKRATHLCGVWVQVNSGSTGTYDTKEGGHGHKIRGVNAVKGTQVRDSGNPKLGDRTETRGHTGLILHDKPRKGAVRSKLPYFKKFCDLRKHRPIFPLATGSTFSLPESSC